jgi:hypothetical protein
MTRRWNQLLHGTCSNCGLEQIFKDGWKRRSIVPKSQFHYGRTYTGCLVALSYGLRHRWSSYVYWTVLVSGLILLTQEQQTLYNVKTLYNSEFRDRTVRFSESKREYYESYTIARFHSSRTACCICESVTRIGCCRTLRKLLAGWLNPPRSSWGWHFWYFNCLEWTHGSSDDCNFLIYVCLD